MAMEHIKQHDWCASEPDIYFLDENDIDNSVTEKILRNKFRDPLISSESEDEAPASLKINWNEVFNNKKNEKAQRLVVPGLHAIPPFPKVSTLTVQQHYQCLKVLCAESPHILPAEFIPRPTKQDRKIFEELKETYAKEQQEFMEWAKTLWTSNHCVRALRPKPPIEMVYEAEFKMNAHKMQSFPKNYVMAAQIPLDTPNAECEMVPVKELISVNINSLPKITIPDMSERVFLMRPLPVPEPCSKHPCRFFLPSETSMTILPLTEVHKELAQYGADNGAQYVASEDALRCLMQLDQRWTMPFSVCEVMAEEGPVRVGVLEEGVAAAREGSVSRTRAAFRRLLLHALAPPIEASQKRTRVNSAASAGARPAEREPASSDDDEPALLIDTDTEDNAMEIEDSEEKAKLKKGKKDKKVNEDTSPRKLRNSVTESDPKTDYYSCTCKDTFDKPPPRSYKKWKVVNKSSSEEYSMIVHTPHHVRGPTGEVVLEAVPEYQLDLGASQLSPHTRAGQALALMLRKNANVLNARIDSPSGELVSTEVVGAGQLEVGGGAVAGRLFTALDQLRGLLPGHYLLQHELSHGSNALLYRPGAGAGAGGAAAALRLDFAGAAPAEADEAKDLKTAPTLVPLLLPVHKFRKILPCAFTPFGGQLTREARRPAARQKTPPQAIKWPKKKNKKKKKNNNNT